MSALILLADFTPAHDHERRAFCFNAATNGTALAILLFGRNMERSMRLALWCSVACAALGLVASPAKAAAIYNFSQYSSSHKWVTEGDTNLDRSGFTMSARLVVTDEGFNTGWNLGLGINPHGGGPSGYLLDEVLAFSVSFYYGGTLRQTWDLPYMMSLISEGSNVPTFRIGMDGGSGVGVWGSLYLNNTESDISMTFTGPDFYGDFHSDAPYGCFYEGCMFSGHNRTTYTGPSPNNPTPVPEPASLGLFAAGLFGLGFVSMRRVGRKIAMTPA
jgi:hypothetical protein